MPYSSALLKQQRRCIGFGKIPVHRLRYVALCKQVTAMAMSARIEAIEGELITAEVVDGSERYTIVGSLEPQ